MKNFVLFGLLLAAVLVVIYVAAGLINRKPIALHHAVSISLGAGGAVSAVKIISIVLLGLLGNPAIDSPNLAHTVPFSFDDYILVIIGEFCLIWLSIKSIYDSLVTVL